MLCTAHMSYEQAVESSVICVHVFGALIFNNDKIVDIVINLSISPKRLLKNVLTVCIYTVIKIIFFSIILNVHRV